MARHHPTQYDTDPKTRVHIPPNGSGPLGHGDKDCACILIQSVAPLRDLPQRIRQPRFHIQILPFPEGRGGQSESEMGRGCLLRAGRIGVVSTQPCAINRKDAHIKHREPEIKDAYLCNVSWTAITIHAAPQTLMQFGIVPCPQLRRPR